MEIQAAISSLQIIEIDKFVLKRRAIARRVNDSLLGTCLSVIGGSTLTNEEEERTNSWMLIPIRVNTENALAKKNTILAELTKLEIETRPVLTGNFLSQPAIQRITRHSVDPDSFKEATEITNTTFLVGAHHDLSDEQINFLCSSLKDASSI